MGRRKKYGDDINPEILRLYEEEDKSLNQISIDLKIHPEIVKRKLKSMGINVRGRSDAMKNYYKNHGGP